VTGHPQNRLPGHASFCVEFIEGRIDVNVLNAKGVGVTSGSACTSRALQASHVLLALGLPHEIAQGSLLFGLGTDNTKEDIRLCPGSAAADCGKITADVAVVFQIFETGKRRIICLFTAKR